MKICLLDDNGSVIVAYPDPGDVYAILGVILEIVEINGPVADLISAEMLRIEALEDQI